MKILYKSNFQLRYFIRILFGVLAGILINALFFEDWSFPYAALFVWVVFLVSFLIYAWLMPRQIAEEILLETDDKLDFFNNYEAMAQVVSLGNHYGFERKDNYDDIRESAFMKLTRKTDWLEDWAAAELKIYKTSNGQIKAELFMKNRLFQIGPGLFPKLFNFSQDLKLQLS